MFSRIREPGDRHLFIDWMIWFSLIYFNLSKAIKQISITLFTFRIFSIYDSAKEYDQNFFFLCSFLSLLIYPYQRRQAFWKLPSQSKFGWICLFLSSGWRPYFSSFCRGEVLWCWCSGLCSCLWSICRPFSHLLSALLWELSAPRSMNLFTSPTLFTTPKSVFSSICLSFLTISEFRLPPYFFLYQYQIPRWAFSSIAYLHLAFIWAWSYYELLSPS